MQAWLLAPPVGLVRVLSQSTFGAFFAEVFRVTQMTIMQTAIGAVTAAGESWDRVGAATRSFLRGYVTDNAARKLLRQAIEVLGWNRVRALDEETALPPQWGTWVWAITVQAEANWHYSGIPSVHGSLAHHA
ncbi:hypothetical protein [Actinomadura sp. 6N118]|uniref:hypothetical protein n=1 Tax=Actinomadura sp. 6N118 TaxID=3375151 RepID=UPI00379BE0E1